MYFRWFISTICLHVYRQYTCLSSNYIIFWNFKGKDNECYIVKHPKL